MKQRLANIFTAAIAGVVTVAAMGTLTVWAADDHISALRGPVDIDLLPEAPRMEQVENNDIKRKRNYPMQPPTIPHKVDGYAVNINANRCLTCHSRRRVEESQAPMVSVTHYMDRDGNFLAEVSPRRFFCNQCHVPQMQDKPIVANTFEDVDAILRRQTNQN